MKNKVFKIKKDALVTLISDKNNSKNIFAIIICDKNGNLKYVKNGY